MAKKYLGVVKWSNSGRSTKFPFMADDPQAAVEQLRKLAGVTTLNNLNSYQLLELSPDQKDTYSLIVEKVGSGSAPTPLLPAPVSATPVVEEKAYVPSTRALAA